MITPAEVIMSTANDDGKAKKSSKFKKMFHRKKTAASSSPTDLPIEEDTPLKPPPPPPSKEGGKDGIVRMDKYGFLLPSSPQNNNASSPSSSPDQRLQKWQEILERSNPKSKAATAISFSNTQSKVKYYTRRGLPDSMRSRAWTTLTGVDVIMAERQGEYQELVGKAEAEFEKWKETLQDNGGSNDGINRRDSEVSMLGEDSVVSSSHAVLETIDRDIHRTFPKHYLFQSGGDDDNESGSGGGSSSLKDSGMTTEDSDVIDSDDEEDADDDDTEDLTESELTENVSEKKKLFDDMIGRSLDMTACGLLKTVNSEDGGNDNNGKDASKALTGSNTDQSSLSGQSGSTEGYGAGQAALRRILRAYSVYDSEVGYCQGMNFIAAMFLTFLSEEESFWLLVIVMNEEPYKLRELFGEDMAGTHEVLYIAEKLLQQFLPKLSQHLESESIHISMFVTQWLLTVYTSTFPFELVARVWDSFLVEGWKVVYRVMLALLEAASKDIMTYSFEQILNYFRDFPDTVDGGKIMNASLKIPLKRKHIQKHVTEWRRGNAEEQGSKTSSRVNPFRRRDSHESNMSGTVGSKTSSSSKMRFMKKSNGEISIEDLSGKLLPVVGAAKFAVLIKNVLSHDECKEIIDMAEGSGFKPAAIYDAATKTVHRNCTRQIVDNDELAENWFERILGALSDSPHEQKVKECPWIGNKQGDPLRAVSLNERFRVIKYSQGQFFTKHVDAPFTRGADSGDREGEKSLVSVHIYLNEGYKGGVTRFHGGGRWFDVPQTKTGSVLLFESTIPHEAVKVSKGEKYVVRTDIMYSSKTDLSDVAGTGFTQQL